MFERMRPHLVTQLEEIRSAGLEKQERVLTSPQGSVVVGKSLFFTRFNATFENRSGLTVLFEIGATRLIARPLLQAAEAIAVKSPASIAAVGIYARLADGRDRCVVC